MIGRRIGHYEVEEKLGAGGMGEVYRARDLTLGRDVAIKALPPGLAADPERLARFQREGRILASLDHANVARIHDVVETDDGTFLILELAAGRTLQEALAREPLPVGETLEVARQVAAGLEAAHGVGVVHRDLKPSNIALGETGKVKILDFGLAKLVTEAPGDDGFTGLATLAGPATAAGTLLGTVAYMSPEQARGKPVDQRTDVWSFGCVVFECLTGRSAFGRETPSDTLVAILDREPDWSLLPPATPARLRDLLRRCLQKDPERRLPEIAAAGVEIEEMLAADGAGDRGAGGGVRRRGSGSGTNGGDGDRGRGAAPSERHVNRYRVRPRLAGIAVLLLLLLATAWLVQQRVRERARTHVLESTPATSATAALAPSPDATPKRIAVLPFENLGAAADAYFAEGMADEVRNKLTRVPGLIVVARASSNDYRGTSKKLPEIARELDARYLLSATVRWQRSGAASRIRMTPELVEVAGAAAPATRWQDSFDADLADIFEVQGRMATEVAQALELALGAADTRHLEERPTSNLAAYDAYLRAREVTDRGGDLATGREARSLLERAVALDPNFAQAWAYLALNSARAHAFGEPWPELSESARRAAERAMALGPELPVAYVALGGYYREIESDVPRAVATYQRGLELAPRDVDLLRNLGGAQGQRGRLDEALVVQRLAASLDPRSWQTYNALSYTLLMLRRPREAREAADRAMALNPTRVDVLAKILMSYLQEGDLAGARRALAEASQTMEPTSVVALAGWAWKAWLLEPAQQEVLLRLSPEAFGGNRAVWASSLSQAQWLRGDRAAARRFAGEARKSYVQLVTAEAHNPLPHSGLAIALAMLGRRDEAIAEGKAAVAHSSIEKDAWTVGETTMGLAEVYLILGDEEHAIDWIDRGLEGPGVFTPGWLRVDPTFDPLRKNPRFQKLAAGNP